MSDKVAEVPVQFSVLEKSLSVEFLADFPSYVEGLVRGDPGGLILTKKYAENAEKYLNFPLRSEDVWIVTYPKCGNSYIIIYTKAVIFGYEIMITEDLIIGLKNLKFKLQNNCARWQKLNQPNF